MARRLDKEARAREFNDAVIPGPASSESQLSPNARRILEAIDNLPEEEREAFDLIRIQNLTHPEAAGLLGVSERTLRRRLETGHFAVNPTAQRSRAFDFGARSRMIRDRPRAARKTWL